MLSTSLMCQWRLHLSYLQLLYTKLLLALSLRDSSLKKFDLFFFFWILHMLLFLYLFCLLAGNAHFIVRIAFALLRSSNLVSAIECIFVLFFGVCTLSSERSLMMWSLNVASRCPEFTSWLTDFHLVNLEKSLYINSYICKVGTETAFTTKCYSGITFS